MKPSETKILLYQTEQSIDTILIQLSFILNRIMYIKFLDRFEYVNQKIGIPKYPYLEDIWNSIATIEDKNDLLVQRWCQLNEFEIENLFELNKITMFKDLYLIDRDHNALIENVKIEIGHLKTMKKDIQSLE